MIPIGISDKTDTFDAGFLRHHFTRFKLGKPVSKTWGVDNLCRQFCDEHSKVMHYHLDVDSAWMVSNYAYEHVYFNSAENGINGVMYHVTGQDGTRKDGDQGSAFRILPQKEKLMIPLLIEGNLEGIFISQQYELNEDYSKIILLGDSHSLIEMPKFRGRKHATPAGI